MKYDAVIFDCDGTLVDSESLGLRVLTEYASEFGIHITIEEALASYMGNRMATVVEDLECRLGYSLPEVFVPELRQRMVECFRLELHAVPGIMQVLESLDVPYCVASSGPKEKIELTLGITGLIRYFEGKIFSAYEVGVWKPEPDLFLHAAKKLNVDPGACAVIEDSVLGVRAGIAAGMTVFGFAAITPKALLQTEGAIVFDQMSELRALLGMQD